MNQFPAEAYVINGTYCPDRESALKHADAAASCSVKGMYRSGDAERILDAANLRPLEEVSVQVLGEPFGKGINPDGAMTGHVRVMRVRWGSLVTRPAPAATHS